MKLSKYIPCLSRAPKNMKNVRHMPRILLAEPGDNSNKITHLEVENRLLKQQLADERKEHLKQLVEEKSQHWKQLADEKSQHQKQLVEEISHYQKQLADEKSQHWKQLADEREEHRKQLATKDDKIVKLTNDVRELQIEKEKYEKEVVAPVRAKATIEYVECIHDYYYDAYVTETIKPKTEPTVEPWLYGYYHWSIQRRKKVWVWMLTDRSSDYIVNALLDGMKKSKTGPMKIEDFASCIAEAYVDLSQRLHRYLTTGMGTSTANGGLTMVERTENALRVLLKTVQLKVPSKFIVCGSR